MSDFMNFLYGSYIRPYLAAQPMGDAETYRHSLWYDGHTPEEREDVEVLLRFYAAHAFLLGLRTGAGLMREEGVSSPAR